jgi:hypothetical protein
MPHRGSRWLKFPQLALGVPNLLKCLVQVFPNWLKCLAQVFPSKMLN